MRKYMYWVVFFFAFVTKAIKIIFENRKLMHNICIKLRIQIIIIKHIQKKITK